MIISNAKSTAVYDCISGPIMDIRVKNCKDMSSKEIDKELFELQNKIWENIKLALNFQTR